MLLTLLPLAKRSKEERVVRLLTGAAFEWAMHPFPQLQSSLREYALFHHLPGQALRLPDVCCTCRANQSNSVSKNRDLGSPTCVQFFLKSASCN